MATAPTPITALPTPPSASDPTSFDTRADSFLGALPTTVTQMNALGTNAYDNALAAAASETTATTQASNASASASTATTQASNASASAASASASASTATTQASNAASTYISFDTRYLGVKSSAPILNNQSGILVTGALYFDSTLGNMQIYNGSAWQTAAGAITGTFSVSRETHTATASQTLFNLTNSYTPGLNTIMVYRNGVRLLSTDYTETSGSSVTLTTPSTSGDEVFFEIGVVSSGTSTNAGNITFNPAGSVASTNVQDAIAELGSEKQVNLVSGTSIKTLNGTSLLGSGDITITPPVGTGGTTSTASITLTASSAAAMSVTPATPGLYVTLPDATTCTKADNLYAVYNAGDYDYGVKDSAGTQLGWIRARTGAMIGLADNSTAAGVWAYYGLEKTGITAKYVNSTIANTSDTVPESTRRIVVDADRVAFLFGGTSCYVIVYNQTTQTWGAATLVRASIANATYTGVLVAANLLMVCSCDTTTGMETVTVSLSDVTPTVNSGSKASTTLAGNISGSGTGFGRIIPVSTSWVVTYSRSTTTTAIRAITVSGTTPTVGVESALSTGEAGLANLYASGTIVRTVYKDGSTTLTCKPYTVSGSGLSAGTAASATTTASAQFRAFVNGNGNIVANYANANHSAAIFKLTSTTEAVSVGVLSSTTPTNSITAHDYAAVTASKTAYISHASSTTWYANILTDTAGTASVGTELTGTTANNMTGIANFGVSGNAVRFGYSATSQPGQLTFDCSGASPTLSNSVIATCGSVTPRPATSNRYGELSGQQLVVGSSAFTIGNNEYAGGELFTSGSVVRTAAVLLAMSPTSSNVLAPRISNSENWFVRSTGASNTTGIAIQRIEAAA